ncbi:hypothetical protein EVAR_75455_1 [Eumeta japonica]|uniref:Uncharacterized protein n=1 Tax=Eumeta variegata TaxID=151549 RepID=A0A4C1TK46_EUMVA|nr:hypothetical protein EVAR_75455_1 [Eumeta japonica]
MTQALLRSSNVSHSPKPRRVIPHARSGGRADSAGCRLFNTYIDYRGLGPSVIMNLDLKRFALVQCGLRDRCDDVTADAMTINGKDNSTCCPRHGASGRYTRAGAASAGAIADNADTYPRSPRSYLLKLYGASHLIGPEVVKALSIPILCALSGEAKVSRNLVREEGNSIKEHLQRTSSAEHAAPSRSRSFDAARRGGLTSAGIRRSTQLNPGRERHEPQIYVPQTRLGVTRLVVFEFCERRSLFRGK